MFRRPRFLAVLATLALSSACGPDAPGQAGTALAGKWGEAPPDHSNAGGNKFVKVMTRNLYVGADVNALITDIATALALPPEQQPAAIATAVSSFWAFVQATDFPARARLIADEIEAAQPDLVGLQELALYEVGIPRVDPSAPGGFVVDFAPAIDFLALLEAELESRGLAYERGPVVANFSGELPDLSGAFIRLTDRDGILVREGLETANPRKGNYQAALPLPAPLPPVSRGWTMLDVGIHGHWFTFFETHLEEEFTPEVQILQAQQLIGMLQAETLPVVAIGDFNAGPQIVEKLHVPTYTMLAAAFTDTWAVLRPADPGFSCCFNPDLAGGELDSRIDLMLLQGAVRPLATSLVGLDDFTVGPPPLHASDHAGVVSAFRLQKPRHVEVASE